MSAMLEVPHVRIVMHTSDPTVCEIARRLGAACVAKEAPPEILLAAIRGPTGSAEKDKPK